MLRRVCFIITQSKSPSFNLVSQVNRDFGTRFLKMNQKGLCPLLEDPEQYTPDTLDLLEDKEARDYWLNAAEMLVDKYVKFALRGRADKIIEDRAKKFKSCYMEALNELRTDPLARGSLTVRLLLDLNESCLKSQGFHDLWKQQKAVENESALLALNDRLMVIDAIEDFSCTWIELCRGVLAGNMFDWGATAVTQIMEENANFGLKEALARIQQRPWLFDDLDLFIEKIKTSPYHCVALFVDNSGVDVVLGVLPFVRELLKLGTRVIMCANEAPALNDVTCCELKEIVEKVCCMCGTISSAYQDGRLMVKSSGQEGPCLDLRTLDNSLCSELIDRGTDLIILEGMGRALHTNLYARLSCDSLKIAVVKNTWLAHRLGGPLFSVVFLYEPTTNGCN